MKELVSAWPAVIEPNKMMAMIRIRADALLDGVIYRLQVRDLSKPLLIAGHRWRALLANHSREGIRVRQLK